MKLSRLNISGAAAVRNGACAAAATCDIFSSSSMSSGPLAEFVIADQRCERRAAEDAELFFVDLLEQRALIELGRALQIAQQVLLADVQDLDLQLVAGLALVQQILQPAPGAFQLLESRDGAELRSAGCESR